LGTKFLKNGKKNRLGAKKVERERSTKVGIKRGKETTTEPSHRKKG